MPKQRVCKISANNFYWEKCEKNCYKPDRRHTGLQ